MLAILHSCTDLDELEKPGFIDFLNNWHESLNEDGPRKYEVMRQLVSCLLKRTCSSCVPPSLEVLHCSELLEKWHFAEHHEGDSFFNELLF